MTDVTSTRRELAPNAGLKTVMLVTGTTVTGATDTVTMTLADYGFKNVLGFDEFVHTTDYSVIVRQVATATSAVSAGVLTITTSTGNNNKRRVYIVYGE